MRPDIRNRIAERKGRLPAPDEELPEEDERQEFRTENAGQLRDLDNAVATFRKSVRKGVGDSAQAAVVLKKQIDATLAVNASFNTESEKRNEPSAKPSEWPGESEREDKPCHRSMENKSRTGPYQRRRPRPLGRRT